MRVVACLLLLSLFVIVPAVEAGPPSGGSCHVQEEYVTEAHTNGDPRNGEVPTVEPGAERPVECYY
jgi:hypothetical protein